MHRTIQKHAPDVVEFEAKYQALKDAEVAGLDRFMILVARILDDPDLKEALTGPGPIGPAPESPLGGLADEPSPSPRGPGAAFRTPTDDLRRSQGAQPRSPLRFQAPVSLKSDELAAIRARAAGASGHSPHDTPPPPKPVATPERLYSPRVGTATLPAEDASHGRQLETPTLSPGRARSPLGGDPPPPEFATPGPAAQGERGGGQGVLEAALRAARHVEESTGPAVRSPGLKSPLFSLKKRPKGGRGGDVAYPELPGWLEERPFLNGEHALAMLTPGRGPTADEESSQKLGAYPPEMQEILLMDDLLYAFLGVDGRYVKAQSTGGGDGREGGAQETEVSAGVFFEVEPSADTSLKELVGRMLPLCEYVLAVSRYIETRFAYSEGRTAHALAAGMKEILWDWNLMVAQLEHQLRSGRLTLQGMWFYCEPALGAMQVLAEIAGQAAGDDMRGAALLNLMHRLSLKCAGDPVAHELLLRLLSAASAPFLASLHRWLYMGYVDDPYGEFMVEERKDLRKESLSQDVLSTYWQQRYALREPSHIPDFLFDAAEAVLTTGKYLNALRECGRKNVCPLSNEGPIEYGSGGREAVRHVRAAFDFANQELLDHLRTETDLLGHLRSIKRYFLLVQGDFLVHFMDSAHVELEKEAGAVSRSRAQRLLEMAVRTSAAASDPYHENLACTVERRTLEGALASVLGEGGVRHDILRADEDRPIGWDMFTLDYQIQWPLSLVVSRRTFAKYQVIFRHLFQLKRVEYKLAHLWTDYQQARRISRSEPLHRAHLLLQHMMHFVQHVYNYTVFEALEPRWTDLQGRLRSAPTVDQLIGEHENFLDSVLSECLLTRPAILEKIKCLKATCLDFVQLTRKFVTVDAAQAGPTHSLEQSFTARTGPGMMVPISQLEKLKQSTSRPDFGAGVAAFSDAFQGEVSSLIAALQEGAEPHLLNLADQLDFNCYFSNDRSFHY